MHKANQFCGISVLNLEKSFLSPVYDELCVFCVLIGSRKLYPVTFLVRDLLYFLAVPFFFMYKLRFFCLRHFRNLRFYGRIYTYMSRKIKFNKYSRKILCN